MNNLIAIGDHQFNGQAVQTVNARELHQFLAVGKDFSTWIKDRIEQYGFTEGHDYVTHLLPNIGEKGQGRPTKEYAISLDMAKELAMVERNDKGKQARQYFIECERQARNPIAALSRMDLLKLALESEEQRLALESKVAEQAPKVAALDRIATSDGGMCITNAAKDLQMRPKDLFQWLQAHQWIFRRAGGSGWIAYQDKIKAGYLHHKVTTVERSDGTDKTVEQVLVTPKGLARLALLHQRNDKAA